MSPDARGSSARVPLETAARRVLPVDGRQVEEVVVEVGRDLGDRRPAAASRSGRPRHAQTRVASSRLQLDRHRLHVTGTETVCASVAACNKL